VASFTYDPLGRRSTRTVNGLTTRYLYDGPQAVAELNDGQPPVALLTGLRIDEAIARYSEGAERTALTDALGSVIALAGEDQVPTAFYAYSPNGETAASGERTGNASQYTGRENDGTGLYYYRARYYDPALKRFISEDPIGLAGGGNVYGYVWANSPNLSDPYGLDPLTDSQKQYLQPYIPEQDLNNANVHTGEMPWYAPEWATAITRDNDIYFRDKNQKFETPDDMALLGHELVHVGQYRNGMNDLEYLLNGYEENPYEKPAYDLQDRIMKDLRKTYGDQLQQPKCK
jgi:RHS repeat-associated protein